MANLMANMAEEDGSLVETDITGRGLHSSTSQLNLSRF